MKLLYRSKMLAGATLTALLITASPVTVFAQKGSDDTSQAQSTQTNQSQSSEGIPKTVSDTPRTERHNSTTVTSEAASDDATVSTQSDGAETDSLHDRAKQLLQDKRQNKQQRTEAERQTACTQREGNIDQRFSTLGTKADRYLQGFNTIFTKVQAYQTKNQLDVANYDVLVADATAKQTAAMAAVAALKDLSGTKIDCTTADPAGTVATVKTAADDARTALQAYRVSLKTLVNALLAAKRSASATTTTDTSGTSTTNDTTTSGSN